MKIIKNKEKIKERTNPLEIPNYEEEMMDVPGEEVQEQEEETTEEIEKEIEELKTGTKEKSVKPVSKKEELNLPIPELPIQRVVYISDSEALRQILIDVNNLRIEVNDIKIKLEEFE